MDPSPCRNWTGHVIVCGLQGIGLRTVEQLHLAGVQVVIVDDDPDPRLIREVELWKVPCIVGSPRIVTVLEEAGLAGARAVVCAERSEVQTLETALLVSELRPYIRVVVQLANAAVGAAVAQVTGAGSVLDTAALASPSIVEACLGRVAHPMELGGRQFVATQVKVVKPGTLRSHFGSLAPVGVVPADGSDTVACPGRDLEVGPGDLVSVLGTPDELEEAGITVTDPRRAHERTSARRTFRERWRAMWGALRADTNAALRFALLGALVLVLASTVILHLFFRPPGQGSLGWLDSLYFTVETISTVGYGDFSFAHQSSWVLVFGIVLIGAGATLLTAVFALITNLLVSWRIDQSLGRQKVVGMVDHVVVVGLGSVGIRVVEELLAEGREVVVVERNENNRYLNHARALGVPVLLADSTQRQTLQSANVHLASAVAVLTSDDLTNIETGLAVRDFLGERWLTVPVILRVFDRALGQTVERHFDFRHVRSTSALAAPRFVGAALGLEMLGSFTVGRQPFIVGRLSVAPGRGLDGLAMQDLSARTRVVAIERAATEGRLEHPPRRDTRFAPGDRAYLVGPYEELLRVLRREHEGEAAPQS